MKQIALSIEQMKHLEELGLDTSDANIVYINVLNLENTYMLVVKEYYQNCIAAYTLQDILEKLPEFSHLGPFQDEFRCVCRLGIDSASKHSNTMLESAYQMLVWCIENSYIKTNKQ